MKHEKTLYRMAFASLRNSVDAEEVLHDTLVKAVFGFNTLRDRDKAKSWLCGIASHTIADHFRRQSREQLWAIDALDRIISQYEEISDNMIIIEQFMADLPDDWRYVVTMNLYYRISAREIAQITGGSYQAIRRRLTRTYRLLRKSLSEDEVQ